MNMESENKPVLYPRGGEVIFVMPDTNQAGKLKDAKSGRKLTAEYMTLEEWEKRAGEVLKCFYLGLKEATDSKGDTYYLAKLHDGEKPFVAAQSILVQSVSQLPIGQGVEITFTHSEKNQKGGKTAFFEVVELDINLFNAPGND